jgi:hypothetical protein
MITTNKGLIAIVLGLGFVVAMGFGALITGLIIKAKDPIPSIPGTNFTDKLVSEQFIVNPEEKININIPKGFRIKTATSNATHISLYIQNDKGREGILIVEPRTGKILGQYMIGSKQ